MRSIVGNVMPRSIVTILTAVAVMACFSMAAAEPLRVAGLAAEWQGGLSGKAYYSFPLQSGDPAQFTKSDDDRFSNLRLESQRFFCLWGGENGSGHTLYHSLFRTGLKSGSAGIENSILLKLRI